MDCSGNASAAAEKIANFIKFLSMTIRKGIKNVNILILLYEAIAYTYLDLKE